MCAPVRVRAPVRVGAPVRVRAPVRVGVRVVVSCARGVPEGRLSVIV